MRWAVVVFRGLLPQHIPCTPSYYSVYLLRTVLSSPWMKRGNGAHWCPGLEARASAGIWGQRGGGDSRLPPGYQEGLWGAAWKERAGSWVVSFIPVDFPAPAPRACSLFFLLCRQGEDAIFTFTGKKGLDSRSFTVEKAKRSLSRKYAVLQRLNL